ncbi:MAG: hypothetical protein AB7O59_12890 [Pirellulales bacterium]
MLSAHRASRCAFTLVEAMVSTAITVIAGSAVLLGIASAISTADDVLARTQAAGMAEQLMDEIAAQRYCENESAPYEYPLGPQGAARPQFNDLDDYAGLVSQPPLDRFGVALGTGNEEGGQRDPHFCAGANDFAQWQQNVSVYYVDAANPAQALPAGQTSDMRAVEVTISRVESSGAARPLAKLRRVFSYVPIQ